VVNRSGRNDPCPCGSGKKYKRCCLTADQAASRERLRQKSLWGDQLLDAAGAADDDYAFVDVDDDGPALDVKDIVRVCYARGMIRKMSDLRSGRGLQVTEWEAPGIPQDVLDSIVREQVDMLEGEWGDPGAGDPIQVDIIDLEVGRAWITVQIFNRAIALIAGEEGDDVGRIHRLCGALEAAARAAPGGAAAEVLEAGPVERPGRAPQAHSPVDMSAVLEEHRRLGGTCALCGQAVTRRGAAKHLAACAPAHDMTSGTTQEIVYLRATSRGLPAYWLDLEIRADAKLEALDVLLRRTWLECCGHLSAFSTGAVKYFSRGYDFDFMGPLARPTRVAERSMTVRVGEALPPVGARFEYEYDFGSTTQLQISVAASRMGRLGRHATRLLARNVAPTWPCVECGRPATLVCPYCLCVDGEAFACPVHAACHPCGESESLLPVVNSPRMGVCAYGAEF